MAPLLRVKLPSCPQLRHQQVVPKHWLEVWWTVWAAWRGWTDPMRRAVWRRSLSYGRQVNLWMLASGGQRGLWALLPGSLTREQWNLPVEGDLGKANITVNCDFFPPALLLKKTIKIALGVVLYLMVLQHWGAWGLWALGDSLWSSQIHNRLNGWHYQAKTGLCIRKHKISKDKTLIKLTKHYS